MNENLRTKTLEWMQLERKTLEQRKLAEAFYDENLMELISEDFIERNKDKVMEEVQEMVISVGTSYEPIALSIQLFHPERILFLYTTISEKTLEKVVTYCGLKTYQYEKSKINETDPLDIYQEIKNVYLKWDKPEKMYIDFTGGTKAMSVAAAMAGAMINVQLVYVGSNDYLADFRKPNPGSETLFYIMNPVAVFGDLEIEKAMALFAENNYAGAREKLELLKETIPDPQIRQQLNFIYLLSKSYEAWDALDFQPAYENMEQLNFQLKRDRLHRKYVLMDCAGNLRKQETVLEQMNNIPELIQERKNMEILKNGSIMIPLMFTMYQNAATREQQGKLDMSTLLLYRLLEMIEQRRLSHYNLYVSAMDYGNMRCNAKRLPQYIGKTPEEKVEILKHDIMDVKKKVFGKAGNGYMPEQVSLLEGFIILYALHDSIVYQDGKDNVAMIKKLRAMVYLRNNSIFAHGLGPVKEIDFLKFRNYVHEMFVRFCKIEKIDFEEFKEIFRLIDPKTSANYASLEG